MLPVVWRPAPPAGAACAWVTKDELAEMVDPELRELREPAQHRKQPGYGLPAGPLPSAGGSGEGWGEGASGGVGQGAGLAGNWAAQPPPAHGDRPAHDGAAAGSDVSAGTEAATSAAAWTPGSSDDDAARDANAATPSHAGELT